MRINLDDGYGPLNQLCDSRHLTEAGCTFLKQYVDPHHDLELAHVGYPDSRGGKSVIVHAKQSMTLSKPASVTTSNWDCNLSMGPIIYYPGDNQGTRCIVGNFPATGNGSGCFDVTNTGAFRLDGLIAWSANEGANTYDPSEPSAATANLTLDDYLASSNAFDMREARVVSRGFEVANATATIDKQGSVICYEVAQSALNKHSLVASRADAVANVSSSVVARTPPQTVSEAAQAGGPFWPAEDGAMVSNRLASGENPVEFLTRTPFVWCSNTGTNDSSSMASLDFQQDMHADDNVENSKNLAPCLIGNFNTNGAYFTGLSAETTLTVVLHTVVELFPAPYDNAYLSMARTRPMSDPNAINLALQTLKELPFGVPRDENDLGKWFKRAMSTVAKISHKVLPIASKIVAQIPGGEPAARALHYVDKAIPKQKKKKKKSKNNGQPMEPPKRVATFGRPPLN